MVSVNRPIITQAEVEERILAVDDALAEATLDFAVLSDNEAEAEAVYKEAAARALLTHVALHATDAKMTVGERDAKVALSTADELRAWKIAEARRASCREALLSYRSRLDALRTLNANVRAVTT